MADGFLGVFRHQTFEFGLGLLVLEMSGSGPGKDAGEFRPGIRRAHIDDADRLDARAGRLGPEQTRRLPVLDATPELPLGGDDEVLVERISADA